MSKVNEARQKITEEALEINSTLATFVEEAYNTAIEKFAEGIIYVESFHVIYEPMRIVNEQKECMKAAVKKATELKNKVLKETMRKELSKLFGFGKTEEES